MDCPQIVGCADVNLIWAPDVVQHRLSVLPCRCTYLMHTRPCFFSLKARKNKRSSTSGIVHVHDHAWAMQRCRVRVQKPADKNHPRTCIKNGHYVHIGLRTASTRHSHRLDLRKTERLSEYAIRNGTADAARVPTAELPMPPPSLQLQAVKVKERSADPTTERQQHGQHHQQKQGDFL